MRNNKNNIISVLENITSFFRDITSHFTGKTKIITLVLIIIMLSFINIILCSSNIFYSSNVSALSYQTSTNIGFTFLPTLNVSLSSDNLTINNLVPGGGAESSNVVTVNVSTNIAEGYNLYATVGSDSSNNANNGYNTTNLVNTVNNDYTLTSLSSNIPNLNSFTNNNWGYSYSNDSGTTWISGDYDNASTGYNGLPLYTNTGIKLIEEAGSTSSTVDFKIAAKASNNQPSGAYTNTINFTAVSNVIPTSLLDSFIAHNASMHNGYFAMQDMTSEICQSVDVEESELQLIDLRDNKLYWVAKLKDGNCWMTQNLDLDLSHEVALTSEMSDIDPESYGKTIYTAETGYSKDEATGIVSWTPSTIDGEGIQRADTIDMVWNSITSAGVPGWTRDDYHPYSANAGDRYKYTNNSGTETVYILLNNCIIGTNDKSGCLHMHIGNYYNWAAAVASNNVIAAGYQYDAENSICPKNWSLPAKGEYGTVLQLQNIWTGSDNNYSINGFLKIRTHPVYFVRSGAIYGNSLTYFSSDGDYWSSGAAGSSKSSSRLLIEANSVKPNASNDRNSGYSVRCLAR